MIDAALIQQCADPSLKAAIVEKFIAAAGSADPRAIAVRAGDRVVLVPPTKTPDEALALLRRYVGHAVVRVGLTQYPAGVGVTDPEQLTADLVDPCKNLRMGTTLFAKVYRIVVKWYGTENENAVDDAIMAWRTGTFEGIGVFSAPDPGPTGAPQVESNKVAPSIELAKPAADQPARESDPNRAGIRVDLSGIGAAKQKD
ncbi:conjugal transfer protein TraH (plasmid) [Afipia carboxidovorans OM5]|uniref:Conjugal transfer protein TraH n=1 Tax=Afipia carboxidovorans (strain ATCC 49405 / DSM 1227 / KCTC 32145 / OM5) TaxID=504832 RepID=F8C173_AFIC5|nr:TraH family protein [Afipia carboxidovorans]AEI04554.1 conjugal transfer protein TraH [Afipia carboxidovorans OM4]AEI08183.1 conjugal transfer protein TraH [Afipia carboxidovorans OM5]